MFAFRPVLLTGCRAPERKVDECVLLGTGGPLQLPAFGVEMAVKNMEYSALDDSKACVPHCIPYSDVYLLYCPGV